MASEAALGLVSSILEAHNLGNTLEALRSEVEKKHGNDVVLTHSAAPERPELYAESYARLEEWIAGSLERFKAEVSSLSFPLFVLSYFKILQLYEPGTDPTVDYAGNFLRQWGGNHALHYPAEMRTISGITRREHLGSDEYARHVLGKDESKARMRFKISFCRVSSELLHSFILANDLILLAVLLNDHVDIAIEDRDPGAMQVVQLLGSCEPAAVAGTENTLKPELLSWGVFPLSISSSSASIEGTDKSKAQAHVTPIPEDARPEFTFLGASLGAVPYPDVNGAAAGASGSQSHDKAATSVLENLMKSYLQHPSPAYPEESAESALTRDHPSATAPAHKPSVYFTTFINAYRGLINLSMTQDATQLAASFSDRVVRVWRLDKEASEMPGDHWQSNDTPLEIKGHSQPVYSLSWSPEQRYLLSAGGDGAVRLSDVKFGRTLVSYQAHISPVWDVQFCPLGHYFISGSHDRTARLWATDHVQPLRMLVGHLSDVTCTAFHPNCNYAFTGSCDKTIRLWDLSSGKCLRIFTGHFGTVCNLAVCPSGRYLASASEDSSVRIWDIQSSKEVALLQDHAGPVYSIDYSVDGAVIASGGADATVRIWDVAGSFDASTSTAGDHCSMRATQTFRTKNTPVAHVRWTRRNLLLAGGAYCF